MNPRRVVFIAAPAAIQPGDYIAAAYAQRTQPAVRQAAWSAARRAGAWEIALSWRAAAAAGASDDPRAFVDAAAVLVPARGTAPWMTMGSAEQPVVAALWRAPATLWRVQAQGLGTSERAAPPAGWRVAAERRGDRWHVRWLLRWPELNAAQTVAFAVWSGAAQDRGGLKAVTPGWLAVV